ncbi:MAG: hypothetical protein QXK24_00885 [Ignisphaera sp.]|uniref:Uncharacterized protein n=1 Tax=Ignisphaera aggregans TaxID=334771 RepID=A0A7C4D0B4_9CREN
MKCRMVTVIPSIILSIAVVLILFLILISMIQYYTSIVIDPPIIPSYGTIYVLDVDNKSGIVRIVNRFGYSVKSLFSISINNNKSVNTNITIPVVLFWVTINPGEMTINIYQYLRRYLGDVKPDYIRWDESGFLIGNTFIPLRKGAGTLRRFSFSEPQTMKYILTGIGTSHDISRRVFSTKYFDGDKISIEFNHELKFGYNRSICGYQTPIVITTYRYGNQCYYRNCSIHGCAQYICTHRVDDVCVKWECQNNRTIEYRCDSTETPQHDYNSYPCGLDNHICTYWTPPITSVTSTSITSLSLRGLINDPGGLAIDRKNFTIFPTSASTLWEYILPEDQQSQCIYIYREISYSTSFSNNRVCCNTCSNESICRIEYLCNQTSFTTYITEKHACRSLGDNWLCAGLEEFLVGDLTSGNVLVEVKQLVSNIFVRFNMTLNYRYTRYYDPELIDNYMRIMPSYTITLTLPPIRGYLSIPYNEILNNASVFVSMNVDKIFSTIRTESGYTDNYLLIDVVLSDWIDSVSTTPVGYIALAPSRDIEGSKTFYFSTTNQPVVSISMRRSDFPYISIPMCLCKNIGCSCSDTITINIVIDLILDIGVIINTTSY